MLTPRDSASAQGKIVLHIDPTGTADPLPFGVDSGPYIIVRVRPMRDNLSLYAVSSCDASDEGEEDYVPTATVATRIVQTSKSAPLEASQRLTYVSSRATSSPMRTLPVSIR